jgi:hypothetical protein
MRPHPHPFRDARSRKDAPGLPGPRASGAFPVFRAARATLNPSPSRADPASRGPHPLEAHRVGVRLSPAYTRKSPSQTPMEMLPQQRK